MSFFNDVLSYFKVDDRSKKVVVTMVLGVGIVVFGNLKIGELSKEKIVLKGKKEFIEIIGENMFISSISKGEIFVSGKISSILSGGVWQIRFI